MARSYWHSVREDLKMKQLLTKRSLYASTLLLFAASGVLLAASRQILTVASTVPPNGDVNPYGVAIVPNTIGNLQAGNILVSNFNNSANLQGTGTTIVQITPGGTTISVPDEIKG